MGSKGRVGSREQRREIRGENWKGKGEWKVRRKGRRMREEVGKGDEGRIGSRHEGREGWQYRRKEEEEEEGNGRPRERKAKRDKKKMGNRERRREIKRM